MRLKRFIVCVFTGMVLAGCTTKQPIPPPVVEVEKAPPVVGTWENNVRGDIKGRMIFKANGELVFQGGLEFYNPGRWDWDPLRKQLFVTLPQAPDPKLDIFKMYVGDGVQAFDRTKKQVTYAFDDQTTTLNVAGWTYSKVDTSKVEVPAEPTLR